MIERAASVKRGKYAFRTVGLITLCVSSVLSISTRAQNPPGASPTPKAAAPIDLTGYWVSIVSEDWRFRMVMPAKGDFQGVPMNQAAARIANAWDPAADEASGNQCKSYGAPALMRVPGRLRVAWQDDTTLKVEADAGTQTRLLRFGPSDPAAEPSWQGQSSAVWELPGRGRGPAGAGGRTGSLKVVTTRLRAGYLRKNGVPYSEDAVLTEYVDIVREGNQTPWMVITSVVDDPRYLQQPFITSTQFKKQADAAGWEPSPCSATW